ncbi:MAG: hypothetical protein K6G00_02285 [Treponema sp.]|nr:hypothetical protein [Treponema sp.]
MTLDEQIAKDLTELYEGREISSAKELHTLIEISCSGLTQHFVGDRDAKTVFVMLNPGSDAEGAEQKLADRRKTYDSTSAQAFIESYVREMQDFGKVHRTDNPCDPFDVKQAAFLRHWKDSGITLPDAFPQDKETFADAKEAVLSQKLQLELLPYSSKKFEVNTKNINLFIPFVEILLGEIFRRERTAVIFGGKIFDSVLRAYNKASGSTVIDLSAQEARLVPIAAGKKYNGRCRPITLRWNGRTQKALIANTFPSQALSKAYEVMQNYGKFCYEQLAAYKAADKISHT